MNLNSLSELKNMLFFKAEANSEVGGGHLQRSLALARECYKNGLNVGFIFSESPDSAYEKVKEYGFEIFEIKREHQFDYKRYLKFIKRDSIIIFDTDDHHFYSGRFIEGFRKNGITTACYSITDSYEITTDVLINPNIISQIQNFKVADYTIKLLGPQYLIFREDFRNINVRGRYKNYPSSIILIFGNADINHLSLYFLDVIEDVRTNFSKINIVVGMLNPDLEKIKARIRKIQHQNIELHVNVSNMINIYKETDLAITAAGMAMWEMALFKIPQMVIASSNREMEYVNYLSELGYISKLGSFKQLLGASKMAAKVDNIIDKEINKLKLEEFRSVINPNGVVNIVNTFKKIINTKKL